MDEHYSLGGKVFTSLKNSILSGEFENGAELREIVLAKKLGVSRTPVREALRQLEQEGLVEIFPNRGAYVKGITYKDVEDIYRIRARLEGLCAEMAVSSITEQQLAKLEETIFLSKYYEEKKDIFPNLHYAKELEKDQILCQKQILFAEYDLLLSS